jgi:hypothetical protein
MSEELHKWEPAPERAENVADAGQDVRGWLNTATEEVIIRQPLLEEDADLPSYGVYSYLRVSKTGLGTNRSLLFRDDSAEQADERIISWLQSATTPADPNRFDTAIDPVEVRREELSHVSSLEDWAHLTGAEYYLSEKIGTRKESSGPVAIFSGSSRRGEGAYIALTKENGPRGRKFASVGYQTDGYYTTDKSLSQTPFEVESPSVSFDRDTIQISGPRASKEITITAQTDNPSHSLNDS